MSQKLREQSSLLRIRASWLERVHPRWRGEHLVDESVIGAGERFIPAGAGNTQSLEHAQRRHAVHPRWRGEHGSGWAAGNAVRGSSPLARGTRPIAADVGCDRRFIPAGAGNTPDGRASSHSSAVHPRWRGEHTSIRSWATLPRGSSPLARGTRLGGWARGDLHRFIPAGAGNTTASAGRLAQTSVHPRWRGEHLLPHLVSASAAGSSPLARGTHPLHGHPDRGRRFIPAGAGNTSIRFLRSASRAVHPRWRGEHINARAGEWMRAGSSPLARGTHKLLPVRVAGPRFIPAGAGNT